ncbi:helix-hairpin-helix domain-containing protein [Streptomyces sp. NPDC021212]|uniref:helix-hairpin-helix domain-containing protein n=1 Tax=Streptomyces sp. NPDC021212 TaxID=3365118 RepID=UPI0037962392
MTTDHLAGDPPPEEATGASADHAAPTDAPTPAGAGTPAPGGAAPTPADASDAADGASDSADAPWGSAPADASGTDARAEATVPGAAGAEGPAADTSGQPPAERTAAEAAQPDAGSAAAGADPEATGTDARTEPTGTGAAAPGGSTAGDSPGQPSAGGGGKGGRSAAAEALAAAVRAVESGERSAASFFNEPRPAPARPRPAPAPEAARAAAAPAPVPQPARPAAAGVAGVREVLAAGGAPEALAVAVAETLGERAAEALREDPWQLLAVPGVRPDQADGFARALLGPECGPDDKRRSQALTGWLLERAALEGHTALESSALRAALAKVSVPDPDEALRAAIAGGGVLVFQDALEVPAGARPAPSDDEDAEQPVRVLLGLDRYALAEESLADGFARLITTFADAHKDEPDWEAAASAAPSPSAAELIRTVAAHGLVTHSGGEAARAEPAALVAAARSMGLRVCAAAHSEDGRRRLAAEVGADAAVTVAGLLSGGEGPGRDEDGALALDLIAVLDAPQLDVEAAAVLVESLPDGARLVLSGDPGVLWSAGPGRVFADLLAARRCPQVVSRTPDPGPIGELVSGIGIGELNQVEAPGKEVVIVPVRDAGEAVHRTVQLVADSVPRAIGVASEQTQVITPGHGGAAGTRALNAALKERLNPGPGRFAGFDPGDRVAYTPAPGRALPGTVVSADAEGLRLDCAGAPVVVPREQVGDLVRHGWALTAHQAAGMRWPAAVVVLPGDAGAGLTRAWIYTAFGRGERHLSVVHGVEAALPRAVAEIPFKDRTTRLRSLLRTQAPPTG